MTCVCFRNFFVLAHAFECSQYAKYNTVAAPPTPTRPIGGVQTTLSDAARGQVVVEDKAAANQQKQQS